MSAEHGPRYPCRRHPETPAAGPCHYCGWQYCAVCLETFQDREFCPTCLESLRGPGAADASPPEGASPAPASPAPAPSPSPRLPGWLSGLLYLVGFVLLVQTLGQLLLLPLAGAKLALGGVSPETLDARTLLSPVGLGVPLWSLLLGLFTWGSLLLTLLYTALMARGVERRSLGDLGLGRTGTIGRDLVVGLLLAAVLFFWLLGLGAAQGWYRLGRPTPLPDALLTVFGGFALLLPYAAMEEICIRGYLLQSVARSWGRPAGVALSTLAFSALHAANPSFGDHPLSAVGLVLAGLYLASAYLITGNLWLAIFLHTGWNLMEGPVFGLPVSGMDSPVAVVRVQAAGPELWTGGAFGPEAGLLLILLLALHTGALWALRPLLSPREVRGRTSPAG